jgi:hypothetical protein
MDLPGVRIENGEAVLAGSPAPIRAAKAGITPGRRAECVSGAHSIAVAELRSLLERVLRRAGKHDFRAIGANILQDEFLERNHHQAGAEAEKAADLEHGEADARGR